MEIVGSGLAVAAGLALASFVVYWVIAIRSNTMIVSKHFDELGNADYSKKNTKYFKFRSLWKMVRTDTFPQAIFKLVLLARKIIFGVVIGLLG